MKILKQLTKICLSLTLLLVFQVGLANAEATGGKNDKSKQEQEQERDQQTGPKKVIDKLDPESNIIRDQEQEGEEADEDPTESEVKTTAPQDSVKDDSVSKYNILFYFLYKFKYEQEEL